MDKQEIFNTVWTELTKQGEPSMGRPIDETSPVEKVCRYRGDSGLKCAVGHIIDDYEAGVMEGTSVRANLRTGDLPERLVPFVDLLAELQDAHDLPAINGDLGPEWVAAFHEQARLIASYHKLNIPGE